MRYLAVTQCHALMHCLTALHDSVLQQTCNNIVRDLQGLQLAGRACCMFEHCAGNLVCS